MKQRCQTDKVIVDGNWEEYMWPHQIERDPADHQSDGASGVPAQQLPVRNDYDNIIQSGAIQGGSFLNSTLHNLTINIHSQSSPGRNLPAMHASPELETKSEAAEPPFLLLNSSGFAADHQSALLGLYRKAEGRSEYIQENDSKYGNSNSETILSISQRIWSIKNEFGQVCLQASTPSDSPLSVKWQCQDDDYAWRDDPALKVTGLDERPKCECQITLSLSEKVAKDMEQPGVTGVFQSNGSYYLGRPVLRHSRGQFTLNVGDGCWRVASGVRGQEHLRSYTVPSPCPADPRAARNDWQDLENWRYYSRQQRELTGSPAIGLKCNKHRHN